MGLWNDVPRELREKRGMVLGRRLMKQVKRLLSDVCCKRLFDMLK